MRPVQGADVEVVTQPHPAYKLLHRSESLRIKNASGISLPTESEMMKSTVGPSQRQEERPGPAAALDAASLLRQYRFVRGRTEACAKPWPAKIMSSSPCPTPVP